MESRTSPVDTFTFDVNLDPDGTVRRFRAREPDGEQRARIWREGLRVYPGWSQYERRASQRRIAVFLLDLT